MREVKLELEMEDGEKKFANTGIQVDEREVRDNGFEQSKETQVFNELRDHLIKIMSRLSDDTAYYDMVYEEMDLDQLMKVTLNDVYFDLCPGRYSYYQL